MRLPKEAAAILQDWFDANTHHPYLTSDSKAELVAQTGLSGEQVTDWLKYARSKLSKLGDFKLKDRSKKLPAAAVAVLQKWFDANTDHPYLTSDERAELAAQTGLTEKQVINWLSYARSKLSKLGDFKLKDRSKKLPATAVAALQKWFEANTGDPYLTPDERAELAAQTGLTEKQVMNWMTHARAKLVRLGDMKFKDRRKKYPAEVVTHLKAWYYNHRDNIKLTEVDKQELAELTGLTKRQISAWVYDKERHSRSKMHGTSGIGSSAAKTDRQVDDKRLLSEAKRVVEEWLNAHNAKPYPSYAVLKLWQEEYGVTRDHVAQWVQSNVELACPYGQATTAKDRTRTTRELQRWLTTNANTFYPTVAAMKELMEKTKMTEEDIDEWLLKELFSGTDHADSGGDILDLGIEKDHIDVVTRQPHYDNGKSDLSKNGAGSHHATLNVNAPQLSAQTPSDIVPCGTEQGHTPSQYRHGLSDDSDVDEDYDCKDDEDNDHDHSPGSDSDGDDAPPTRIQAAIPSTAPSTTAASTTMLTIITATPPAGSATAMANNQRSTAKRQSTSHTTQPAKRTLHLPSEVKQSRAVSTASANFEDPSPNRLVQETRSADNDAAFCAVSIDNNTWSAFIQLQQQFPTDAVTEDVRARLWSAAVSLRQQGKLNRLEALVGACRAVISNKYACQVPEVWLDLCAAFE